MPPTFVSSRTVAFLVASVCLYILGDLWVDYTFAKWVSTEQVDCDAHAIQAMARAGKPDVKVYTSQREMKLFYHTQQMQRQMVTMDTVGRKFFQRNWEPSYACFTAVRLGCPGDGGKWVCDPDRYLGGGEPCVVYSVGSNDEFSFERAVHAMNPRCEIHSFDPTVTNPRNQPSYVTLHPWALGGWDNDADSMYTIPTMMRKLGHGRLALLKVDCEGCEFEALRVLPRFGVIEQILVEVHFTGDARQMHALFMGLNMSGYVIFSKEANLVGSYGDCVEYGFVRLAGQLE